MWWLQNYQRSDRDQRYNMNDNKRSYGRNEQFTVKNTLRCGMDIMNQLYFWRPRQMTELIPGKEHDKSRWCDFHKDYGQLISLMVTMIFTCIFYKQESHKFQQINKQNKNQKGFRRGYSENIERRNSPSIQYADGFTYYSKTRVEKTRSK